MLNNLEAYSWLELIEYLKHAEITKKERNKILKQI